MYTHICICISIFYILDSFVSDIVLALQLSKVMSGLRDSSSRVGSEIGNLASAVGGRQGFKTDTTWRLMGADM